MYRHNAMRRDVMFQSSSSPKAGCYVPGVDLLVCRFTGFNPHPARRLDATCSNQGYAAALHECFNPHPARRLDATCMPYLRQSVHDQFQSSSSPKAGCYDYSVFTSLCQTQFQSSSSPKAGCYARYASMCSAVDDVSILIQPEGWMLPEADANQLVHTLVSILIQPEGWMLR